MEEHKFLIVEVINNSLRKLLSVFFKFENSKYIIPTHIIMALIASIVLITLLKLGTRKLDLLPGKIQVFLETVYKFFEGMVIDFLGKGGRKYVSVIGTMGLFIFTANMLGLFPDLASPTAYYNVTLGCAVFIFIYYHIQGIKKHGFLKYLKQFTGPVWYLSFIFFPIEIISHISRVLSLSLRLFVNIYGEDLVILSIISIFAYVTPIPMMVFAIFTSILQAYIFISLSLIYLSGALATEH